MRHPDRLGTAALALALALVGFSTAGARPAHAQAKAKAKGLPGGSASAVPGPEPEPEALGDAAKERPWAAGVSVDLQQSALSHFREGNALLKESLFRQAVEKYRLALREWDHPGIHYNLALALLNLDQPLEVHDHLERALKYGPAPLDADKFEHAKSYLVLIEKQLAPVDIRCDVEGAVVSLDGATLFRAPGQYKSLIRPGPHTITAAKEGFPTTERTRVLLPGQATELNLKVYAAGELIGYRRNWDYWKPVAVTVAGGVLLAAGVVMTLEARSQLDSYDSMVKNSCPTGCVPASSITSHKDTGDLLQTLSWVSYGLGAAGVATGVYLLYMNREIPYRIEPEKTETQPGPTVTPVVGLGSVGLAGRF